ncbi:MAG: hypothetical protein KW802_04665, partial [Candidatus Doudnabacteria bacterium]|nr:hypothetical protein [Candidatus Doudnabacteria bacterium]
MSEVSYHDYEGFAQIGELVEGTLTKYWEKDPKTGLGRHYGFVALESGTSVFAHRNNRHHMAAYGIGKLGFIPLFTEQWPVERSFGEPREGEKVVGVIGKDRSGRSCLVAWSYPSELEYALKQCDAYLAHEKER